MASKVIALFGMSFHPAQGRYLRVRNQLRALAAAGHDVLLLCWDREGRLPMEESRDGIRIRRIRIPAPVGAGPRRNAGNVLRFNRAAYRHLMREPVDVVHCYNLDAIFAAFVAAKRRRARAVLDLCEPEYYALWKARYRWLLGVVNAIELGLARRFDHVLVHNRFQVRKFEEAGIRHLTQVGSYPNRDVIPEAPTRSDGARFVIGRLGTIYEDNGIEEILEAYRMLLDRERDRRDGPAFHLFLAGRVFDRYRETFERLVEPFRDRMTVHGAFDASEMAALYRRIDLSLVLARRTRWFRNITPTKLFDSMACGVPVLASDIGEARETIDEGRFGLIVDERDPRAICEAIEAIALPPGVRDGMARNAVALARRRYTWEACEPGFLAAYSRVMEGAPGLAPAVGSPSAGGPHSARG
jgi:glycosyltransferase involved in cell wall biosynthesis